MSTAMQAIAATQHFVQNARGKLKSSWALCGTWKRLEPTSRSPPWTVDFTVAVVSVLLTMDLVDPALCVLLAFNCLLRTIEFTSLRSIDFITTQESMYIDLGITNMGHRDARIDTVEITDAKLRKLFRKGNTCGQKRLCVD